MSDPSDVEQAVESSGAWLRKVILDYRRGYIAGIPSNGAVDRISQLLASYERLRLEVTELREQERYWRHEVVTTQLCPVDHRQPHISHDCISKIKALPAEAVAQERTKLEKAVKALEEIESCLQGKARMREIAAKAIFDAWTPALPTPEQSQATVERMISAEEEALSKSSCCYGFISFGHHDDTCEESK